MGLQRFGLLSFRPRALRRLIELLIGDPYVQKLARLHVARVALAEPPSELNGHEADDDQGDNGDDQNAAE
jgi:hypothetical protein